MSTMDDLRSTLDRHAAELDDHDLHVRPVAVRERIRVVRRRRRGIAAGALAVVLAAAGTGLVPLLHGSPPAPAGPPHRLAGHDVPSRVTVLGFGYRYVDAVPTAEVARGTVALASSSTDRVVSLVTDHLGGGVATLFEGSRPIARSRGGGSLERPVPVSAEATRLRVRLSGAPDDATAALAVYRRDGSLPEGVSNGTAVFRSTVAGQDLVAGAFSHPGDRELRFHFTAPLGEVGFAQYCSATGRGLHLHISVDGDGGLIGDCRGNDQQDAGFADFSVDSHQTAREHIVRVWLTAPDAVGDAEHRVAVPGAVLGLGVYRAQSSDSVVQGLRVPSTVEDAGRTWILARTVDNGSGSHELSRTLDTGDGPLVLGFVTSGGHLSLRTDGRFVPAADEGSWSNGPGMFGPGTLLLAGDRYRVTVGEERPGRTFEGMLLVYRLAD